MKSSILISALILSASSIVLAAPQDPATAPKCKAEFRKKMPTGLVDQKSADLKPVYDDNFFYKVEADLGEYSYIVTFEKGTNKALATVVRAPDYIEGAVSSTSFNEEGRFTVSKVDGETVGKITCVKN